mgnify:FL=1
MEYIYLGKIVNTHGIKGEVRIISNFRYKSRVFVKGFTIYIGKKKDKEVIDSYRVHKNYDMIVMKEYANINEVLKYKGEAVYIKKDDLKLERGEVLDEDLIGMKVFMNGEEKGKVSKVLREKQDRLVVVNDRGKYYIPYVKGVVKEINLKEGIILEDISGLFD